MKLSIVTVNKNNAPGLEKTCLSIVTQTYQNFEWIIIDGNSEDNSIDIIKKYSNRAAYWVSESDTGIYNAMNKGIKSSSGEYLLFLNSGDYLINPWTLQEAFDEIKNSQYTDVYFSNAVSCSYYIYKYPQEITLDYLLHFSINHQNCLIRRELFKNQLYDENYKIISDSYFLIKQIIENKITFFHIKTMISIYDDINGISSKAPKISRLEKELALKKLNVIIKKNISVWNILKNIKYILPYGIYKLLKLFLNYIRAHNE
jgi:glycosyltransferase involved in cell wall biosynthesis